MAVTAPSLAPPSRHVRPRVGPYSRSGAVALLDGRSREAQYMRQVRSDLIKHVGGSPSAVQRQLIERAVRLSLQLELMDERLMHHESFTAHDHNAYLAWSNALTRTLARLGLSAAKSKPTLPNPNQTGRGMGIADLIASAQ
jgi:hypothetical protein